MVDWSNGPVGPGWLMMFASLVAEEQPQPILPATYTIPIGTGAFPSVISEIRELRNQRNVDVAAALFLLKQR